LSRYLITSALPYANGPKHIGHLAGAYLPADIYVRYLRAQKEDVVFVCGSDEHGAAITLQALKEKTTPKEIVDKYHALLEKCFAEFNISFDIYHRTSDPLHHKTAQDVFTVLHEKGVFQVDESEQYFDVKMNVFLADRYIKGTCPNCGYDSAYGDQCERCGKSLSPDELIDPVSTLSGEKPERRKTKHWSLPLNNFNGFLEEWLIKGKKDIFRNTVYGQCKSWIDAGLQPRAVTRDLEWGVKVPLKEAEGKVLYVWFDAPIGYISATKAWAEKTGKDWKPYWCDSETKLVHFIGKDNIVFHCIIFPVVLHAHGNFILPYNVPANEFLNLEGDKMSTSRGWSIEMHEFLEAFPDKTDELRYYLTAIAPETKDADFTWKGFQTANKSELVDILGNFVNRVLSLTHKFYNGVVPVFSDLNLQDANLRKDTLDQVDKVHRLISEYKFRDAQFEMMNLARIGNKYLADAEPWKIIKTDEIRTATIMHSALQLTVHLARLMQYFMPLKSKQLAGMINFNLSQYEYDFEQLKSGHQISEAPFLYKAIEDEVIDAQIQKLKQREENKEAEKAITEKAEYKSLKPEITIDDFSKIDLRTGTILEAKKVEKADKLLQLTIDLGFEKRTVLSGIAMHYKPEDIIGKRITLVANLAPRKMRGIDSQGMILMAEDANGKLVFVNAEEEIKNGSDVK
jgi:methionyl-tRNA synthetase